jgi:cytoplasmic polyadenylation element-binding protein
MGMNNGYVLLVYDEERSVQRLMAACNRHGAAFYICLSSQTIRHKPVQVRPWLLSDGQYMPNPSSFLEPRWTVKNYNFVFEIHFACYLPI